MWNYIKNNEAITVAILSALAYVATYIFECGYANFYGIPKELISISLGNIITMSLTLFVVSYMCFIFCSLPLVLMARLNKNIYISTILPRIISFSIFVTIILFLNGSANYINLKKTIYTMVAIFFMASFMAFLKEKEKEKEKEKAIQMNEASPFKVIDSTFANLFIAGAASMIFILSCGTYIAKTTLPLGNIQLSGKEYSIIRVYGENFIAIAKEDMSKETAKRNKIYIFKGEDLKSTPIITHEVKPAKENKINTP
ncbi:hypothetical protein [Enterobacter ludwigii]